MIKTILYFIKPYRKLLFFTIIFIICDVLGALYIPTLTADMINSGVNTGDMDYIMQKGTIMLLITVLAGIATLIGTYLSASLSTKIGRDMRNAIYKKSLELSNFDFKQYGTDSMITRTLNDVNVIQQAVSIFIQLILPVPFMCMIGIIMAFSIDYNMGLLLIGMTIIIIISTIFVTKKASIIFEKLQLFLDKMNAVLRENITGVRVIRAFNKEVHEKNKMKNSFEDYAQSSIKANRLFAGLDSLALLVINIAIIAILWIGGNRIGAGFMEIGDITALTEYAILILFYIVMAQMVIMLMPRAVTCLRRIKEVLETDIQIHDGNNQFNNQEMQRIIQFEDVVFQYADADEDTLNHINFTCEKGKITAIIGSTGSGKSTIAGLIMRFHDVTQGKILLKGQDIREISQKELRNHISYIPQTAWLFSGTIEDNLRYGDLKATKEELEKSLKIAQSDFVDTLEDGMKSIVSQGGKNFSGGQKQRLSIARALTKKADLYIFDDSFSALDFKTDSKLRKALAAEMKDAAMLIIAQRISTIMTADQIIVLNDGEIAGMGTHIELMQNCSIYQDIAKTQLKEESKNE